MKIESKFVYVRNKKDFEPLIDTIPDNLNPIVFIEDTKEIWTCGTYFNVGYSTFEISENNGAVIITLGNSSFSLTPSGDSLSIRKGTSNNIIISSNALVNISTNEPLKWTDDKKLIHLLSGVTSGTYGPTSNSSNANIVQVPSITVTDHGHVSNISTKNIQIRDYVNQIAPTEIPIYRNILLSYEGQNTSDDTNAVRKANGLSYNDSTKTLNVAGGINAGASVNINNGDLVVTEGYIVGKVKGDVEGQAVPKVHLSKKPEYGGASVNMYGHVLLQDTVPTEKPPESSNNVDVNNTGVEAVAASPLMVWNSIQQMQEYIDNYGVDITAVNSNNETESLSKGFHFSKDFVVDDNNIYLSWEEI